MVGRVLHRIITGGILPALLCLLLGQPASSGAPSEYRIKAAYLYNFAKFVEWPALPGDAQTFCVGIWGDDPFGKDIETLLSGKTIQDKPITVRHINSADEAARCQILFIAASENDRLDRIFNDLDQLPILTVGETSRFFQQGGMIRFQTVHHNVRFNINLSAAQAAKLKISSQLLKVANYVHGAPMGAE